MNKFQHDKELKKGAPKEYIVLKMLYLIGSDGLVNQGFVNFQKMVWMTKYSSWLFLCHLFLLTSMLFFFWKFAHPQFTRYAEYIGFCHK